MWEYSYAYSDHLEHHGILGQKWGIRRFQNPDGTLTEAGRKRYGLSNKDRDKLVELYSNGRSANYKKGSKFYRLVLKNKAVKDEVNKTVEKYADAYKKLAAKYQKRSDKGDDYFDDLDDKLTDLYGKIQNDNDEFMAKLYGKNGETPAWETKDSSGNTVYTFKLSSAASGIMDEEIRSKLLRKYGSDGMY